MENLTNTCYMLSFELFKKWLFIIALLFFVDAYSQESWTMSLPNIGTFSSPRITDLNGDGIGDIILGAGRQEFLACDSAVVALNGKNGDLLWKVKAKDQIFGSATLKDINNDGVMDVFIGGRSAELKAIDGHSGKILWSFKVPKSQKKEWYNFYNPQFVPDQNNDGFEDLLVSNGGDVNAEPYDLNRPSGFLVIIDGQKGDVIARAQMPDGKETYMSVSVLPHESDTFKSVIFGTGGETVGGSLYVTSLSEILEEDLSKSVELATSKSKGFIGPGVWVDINNDDIPDIVSNAVDGRLLAFDGSNHKEIWSVEVSDTEAYGSVAVGNFNKDSIPDFFVSFADGIWPNLEWSNQIMVNGKSGVIEFEDSLGFYQMSTPVVIDSNNDGIDEVILPMNYKETDSFYLTYFYSNLAVINFVTDEVSFLEDKYSGHNLSSTPWVGDMDNNGFIDIVFIHGTNNRNAYSFDGFQVHKIVTKIPADKKIRWGSYMGTNYDGIYEK